MQSISLKAALLSGVLLLAGAFTGSRAMAAQDSELSSPTVTPTGCGGASADGEQAREVRGAVRLPPQQLLKLVTKQTPLVPPGMLHDSKLHGDVTVEVCIDDTGGVARVTGVKGHPFAISSAVESVRGWTFVPYKRHGVATWAFGLLTLKYDWRGGSREP